MKDCLSKEIMWTSNDLNCKKIVKTSPAFRKRVRRAVKRRQKQKILANVVQELGALCPECRGFLKFESDFVADNTHERIFSCHNCGAAWIQYAVNGVESDLQRYFIG